MNVVEAHNVLQGEHDGDEGPAKSHKKEIFADAPKDIYQNTVAVFDIISGTELLLGVEIKAGDFFGNPVLLQGSLAGSDQSLVLDLNSP